jgi:DNA-binding transcriptional regulator/RsmH inhibitor MraZ
MSRLFVGSAISTIGRSGNLVLPDEFYMTIMRRKSRSRLYVCAREYLECLVVVDEAYILDAFDRFERQRTEDGGVATIEELDSLRRNFGFVAPTKVDSKGHVRISPSLNEWRGESRQVLLIGIGDGFEVWDLEYVLDRGRPDLRSIASLHLKDMNTKGVRREPSVQSIRPYHSHGVAKEPRLPIQPLHALLPRHDTIVGRDNL